MTLNLKHFFISAFKKKHLLVHLKRNALTYKLLHCIMGGGENHTFWVPNKRQSTEDKYQQVSQNSLYRRICLLVNALQKLFQKSVF